MLRYHLLLDMQTGRLCSCRFVLPTQVNAALTAATVLGYTQYMLARTAIHCVLHGCESMLQLLQSNECSGTGKGVGALC
jgi:hypothetical protein